MTNEQIRDALDATEGGPGSPVDEAGQVEPVVSYKNVPRSDALDETILRGVDGLSEVHRRITSCRIVLERLRAGRQSGDEYSARIDVTIPGGEIVVNHASPKEGKDDVLVVVSHAFDAARRQLREFVHRQRGDVKRHVDQPRGSVIKLALAEGYGFIRSEDGREFYFHEHSVLDGGFDVLEVGSEVRFVEGKGEKGPSATTVVPTGALHLLD